jgi:hypothetical protein
MHPKSRAKIYIYIDRDLTQAQTKTMDEKTKDFIKQAEKERNRLITAMVFIAEETNGLVIHFNGFFDEQHARSFIDRLMKNSGIEYKSIKELMDIPTLH